MTTNKLLQAKDKIIQEQAEKLQQMSEQIDKLKNSVELYRQAAAMARAAHSAAGRKRPYRKAMRSSLCLTKQQEASPKANSFRQKRSMSAWKYSGSPPSSR